MGPELKTSDRTTSSRTDIASEGWANLQSDASFKTVREAIRFKDRRLRSVGCKDGQWTALGSERRGRNARLQWRKR
ncbi:hypothetical protein GCM10007338_00360 [Corynebacterium pelargi]|nr:hypothetical protein GCM10007338_00360 [Corynebacterium pelargi]